MESMTRRNALKSFLPAIGAAVGALGLGEKQDKQVANTDHIDGEVDVTWHNIKMAEEYRIHIEPIRKKE